MRMNDDRLMKELRQFDPVEPEALDAAAEGDAAARLLQRVLAEDPAASGDDRVGAPRRGWWRPTPARLGLAGATIVAVVVTALVLGSSTGGGDGNRLAGALDQAAAVAGSQPRAGVDQPYSYLKAREIAVHRSGADQRSWKVTQATTREEWVTPDGPGRMRIIAGRSRFVGSSDRAEWEGAGRPSFLTLGFGPRTEVHWIAGNVMRKRVEDLPAEPTALSVRLRHEAQAERGELALPATTLQLIAEDLRSPAASPALRRALFEAAKRIPGIRYLGEKTDPEGRPGVAVGVTDYGPEGPARFSLIFDPDTARPLATEATSRPAGATAGDGGPTLLRATVFLGAPEVQPPVEAGGSWLDANAPIAALGPPSTSYLVYRIPGEATTT
jgi:hypothetical protein